MHDPPPHPSPARGEGGVSTLGNRTHAATILGISIRALRNKLRDYAAQGVAVPPPGAGVAA